MLIKTKSMENLCIFTKKDLVVSLLQNFRPSAPDLQYLDRSIEQVEADVKIMLTPQEIWSIKVTQTLHEGLQTIKDRQVVLTDIVPACGGRPRKVREVPKQIAHYGDNGTSHVQLRGLTRCSDQWTSS